MTQAMHLHLSHTPSTRREPPCGPADLERRIEALESEAVTLSDDLRITPVFAQDEAGTWGRFQRFGTTARDLIREVVRRSDHDTSPEKADSDRAIGRIEAAYQRVHEAIQEIALLVLADRLPSA